MDEFQRPEYDRDVKKLVNAYKQALADVSERVGTLASLPLSSIDRQQSASLAAQVSYILRDLDSTSRKWADATIRKGFTRGYASKIISTVNEAESAAEAAKLAEFSLLNRHTVDALIADTYKDLLAATKNTEARVKDVVRRVVSEQMVNKAAQQLGRKTINRDITKQLTKEGLSRKIQEEGWIGIVDKAGRRWNLTTYVDMVSRTKLQQAYIEGVKRKADDRGYDLAVISSHGAKDACSHYEGAIISMNGNTPGYPTYADMLASGSIFHPNCKHTVSIIRSPHLLPDKVRDKAEEATRKAAELTGTEYKGLPKPPTVEKKVETKAATPTYKFVPTKTIKEANEWAKANLGIDYVDYKGYAVELANDVNRTLEQLRTRFHEVNDTKFIGTIQARNRQEYADKLEEYTQLWLKDGVLTRADAEKAAKNYTKSFLKMRKTSGDTYAESTSHHFKRQEGIAFNEVWAKDYEKFSKSVAHCVEVNWHPVGTEDPSSVLTHEFGHQVDNFLKKEGIRKTVIDDQRARYTKTEVEQGLSRYAAKNDAEFFAEAFAEYMHNPNPRPIAADVGKALEEALNKYRRGL